MKKTLKFLLLGLLLVSCASKNKVLEFPLVGASNTTMLVFEKAVNEYCFGGEKDFAKKCNIIINSDLSNNSYGIHFTEDEYFFAGKSHKNGVHIDFGYARMFSK